MQVPSPLTGTSGKVSGQVKAPDASYSPNRQDASAATARRGVLPPVRESDLQSSALARRQHAARRTHAEHEQFEADLGTITAPGRQGPC